MNTKPHVFIIDENKETMMCVTKSNRCVVNAYTDYKNLLLDLNMGKFDNCDVGFIHQNGSVSLAAFLKNYVEGTKPHIKLMVYKNENELKKLLLSQELI